MKLLTGKRSIQTSFQFNLIYLYSAFHNTNRCKAALQKPSYYIYYIFSSRLLVVTMAEMYSSNYAASYKLHVIKLKSK